MMPLAPHMSLPPISHITANTNSSSKPKLAFSIDSIVGHNNSAANDNVSKTHISDRKDKPMPSSAIVHRNSPQIKSPPNNSPLQPQPASPPSQQQHNPQLSKKLQILSPQISPHNQIRAESGNSHTNINNNNRNNISPLSTPSPLTAQYMNGAMQYSSPQISSNHHHLHEHPLASMQSPVTGAQSQISAHTLMMAAAAHHMPTVPQDYHHAVALYPYLFRAHPFVNRFHGMPFEGGIPSFLLPPFRKPKRIRTAFSPGQLLKLEQAFEKNHYVVGNERKQLASNLGLSETQVKVWFQNRRTKHKRQKQEEDEQTPNNNSTNSAKDCHFDKMKSCRDSINTDDDDDDMVDEEDIDLEDEDSSREMMSESMRNEHIWHQSMPITTTSSATAPQIMFASTSHSNTPLL